MGWVGLRGQGSEQLVAAPDTGDWGGAKGGVIASLSNSLGHLGPQIWGDACCKVQAR